MNLDLSGKYALVCGGSKGIGRAVATELAHMGANITLVARDAAGLAAALATLPKRAGQDHDFLAADFSNPEDLRKRVITLIQVRNYQVLINNTGGPAGGPTLEAAATAFEDTFRKHLVCSHLLAQLVVPGMKQSGYGRIINVISTSVKEPIEGLGVSNTIRGAMGNWAKSLANELGPDGITVNNILPGFTRTERLDEIIRGKAGSTEQTEEEITASMQKTVPLRRFAQPEEIAAAAAFLASPAAAYISGINLPVDGGRTRSL